MSTRLQTIATRQAKTRVRDALFAAFVVLATVISISSVGTAANAASSQPTHAVVAEAAR